ncbi:MAG: hypothetical protein JHD02_00095 [Thermoleophilaceae bacterium]|nr:hypothetical protein [Thermoleophilaceae bacterium]
MRGPTTSLGQDTQPMDREFRVICVSAVRAARMLVRRVVVAIDEGNDEVARLIESASTNGSLEITARLEGFHAHLDQTSEGNGILRTLVLGSTDSEVVRIGIVLGRAGRTYIRIGVGLVLGDSGWQVAEFASARAESKA